MTRDTNDDENTRCSSPPCLLHEVRPDYQGFADEAELVLLLNELLEAERAGAKVALRMSREAGDPAIDMALQLVAADEARFCAMLCQHIERLGRSATRKTGGFYSKVMAVDDLDARLKMLNRGQGWVVRKLVGALPRIADEQLRRDLEHMLAIHKHNIEECESLIPKVP